MIESHISHRQASGKYSRSPHLAVGAQQQHPPHIRAPAGTSLRTGHGPSRTQQLRRAYGCWPPTAATSKFRVGSAVGPDGATDATTGRQVRARYNNIVRQGDFRRCHPGWRGGRRRGRRRWTRKREEVDVREAAGGTAIPPTRRPGTVARGTIMVMMGPSLARLEISLKNCVLWQWRLMLITFK